MQGLENNMSIHYEYTTFIQQGCIKLIKSDSIFLF